MGAPTNVAMARIFGCQICERKLRNASGDACMVRYVDLERSDINKD